MIVKALLLTSLSGRGRGMGQGAVPTGPRKGWGGEGGGQEKIPIVGFKCSIWLQLSLNSTLKRLRPEFDLRAPEVSQSTEELRITKVYARGRDWTIHSAAGIPRWL